MADELIGARNKIPHPIRISYNMSNEKTKAVIFSSINMNDAQFYSITVIFKDNLVSNVEWLDIFQKNKRNLG